MAVEAISVVFIGTSSGFDSNTEPFWGCMRRDTIVD